MHKLKGSGGIHPQNFKYTDINSETMHVWAEILQAMKAKEVSFLTNFYIEQLIIFSGQELCLSKWSMFQAFFCRSCFFFCITKWSNSLSYGPALKFNHFSMNLACVSVRPWDVHQLRETQKICEGWHVWITQELMSHLLNIALSFEMHYIYSFSALLLTWCFTPFSFSPVCAGLS